MSGHIHACMHACMHTTYTDTYTDMYAYRMQFLEICLSNTEYISDHRCERTNMAAK